MADLVALVTSETERGADAVQTCDLLATAEETLAQFRLHRAHIARTIADIDAGLL